MRRTLLREVRERIHAALSALDSPIALLNLSQRIAMCLHSIPRMGLVLLVVATLVACGSRSTPTAPAPMTTVVAEHDSLTLHKCSVSGDACRFTFGVTNAGPECASNLRGAIAETRDGGASSAANWSWMGVLSPRQTVGVDGCCVGLSGTFAIQPSWDSVSCP
jgi:hypothetical protein